jgi:hypothetical protein
MSFSAAAIKAYSLGRIQLDDDGNPINGVANAHSRPDVALANYIQKCRDTHNFKTFDQAKTYALETAEGQRLLKAYEEATRGHALRSSDAARRTPQQIQSHNAADQIDVLAKRHMASTACLSYSAAVSRVLREHPDLRKLYQGK